jgi:hypothetical protein
MFPADAKKISRQGRHNAMIARFFHAPPEAVHFLSGTVLSGTETPIIPSMRDFLHGIAMQPASSFRMRP